MLQCIAQAERLRSVHAQARRLRNRLYDVMLADPGYPRLPWVGQSVRDKLQKVEERSGYHAADERCWDLFRQYAEATRAAVAVPAHTPDGIHAKLSLGLTAARRGRARVFEYGDYEWLMFALADLDRLAARGAS